MPNMKGFRPLPRELDPINKIASNVRGSIKLPVGMTHFGHQLVTNIPTAAKIAKVEYELNGDIIQTYTGTQLKMMEAYLKHEADSGRYTVPFANVDARNLGGIMSGAIVTYPGDSFIMYVTFGDLTGITDPTLTARAFLMENQTERLFIPRVYETVVFLPKSGKNAINWETPNNRAISRLHMLPDSGALTRLEIYRDSRIEFEADIADINYDLKYLGGAYAKKLPQAGYLHFDPTGTGFNEKGLFPLAARESLKFNIFGDTAGQAVTVLVEELEHVQPGT